MLEGAGLAGEGGGVDEGVEGRVAVRAGPVYLGVGSGGVAGLAEG